MFTFAGVIINRILT